jgi:hypothetical protein
MLPRNLHTNLGLTQYGAYGTAISYYGWLFKTDNMGNDVWSQTFATKPYSASRAEPSDEFSSVQQTNDGGYIIVGEASELGWLLKTDEMGKEIWSRSFEADKDNRDERHTFKSVQQTKDGGYILRGGRFGDDIVIKTDEKGFVKSK